MVVLASFVTLGDSAAATTGACSNAAFRTGPSAALSECRAYEMVSPADKGNTGVMAPDGSGAIVPSQAVLAANSGDGFLFESQGAMQQATGAGLFTIYRAARGPDGWQTTDFSGPQLPTGGLPLPWAAAMTPDLSHGILCDATLETPTVPPYYAGWFLVGQPGSFRPIGVVPPEVNPAVSQCDVADISSDGTRAVFSIFAALTDSGESPSGVNNLYEWVDGTVTLAGVLPGGAISEAIIAGPPFLNPLSRSGSRIFFVTGDGRFTGDGQIYTRSEGATAQVSEPAPGVDDPEGPQRATFRWATPDGSYAFFTSPGHLTADSTTGGPGGGSDLYRYDTASKELIDLTPDQDQSDSSGAQVESVMGVSNDGTTAYFVAFGQLVPGQGAAAGAPNLYVSRDGVIRFIGTLDPADRYLGNSDQPGRVTTDGRFLAFESRASLTGYDNTDSETGEPQSQVFLYDASGGGSLFCVSCRRDGTRPTGGSRITDQGEGTVDSGSERRRNLIEDGRLFFDSDDRLVEGDANGTTDVYEYDAGSLSLISSGRGPLPAYFAGASQDARDAFFWTAAQLVPSDRDEFGDIYDARIGGGLAADHPAAGLECSGEDCQAAAAAPPSASVVGSAALVRAPGAMRGLMRVFTPKLSTGMSAKLRVRASGPGRISVAGRMIRGSSKVVQTSGTYAVRVALNAAARQELAKVHRLSVTVRVTFAARGGSSARKKARLIFKRSVPKHAHHEKGGR